MPDLLKIEGKSEEFKKENIPVVPNSIEETKESDFDSSTKSNLVTTEVRPKSLVETQNEFLGFVISTASIGILFIFAISSLSVYGAVLGGWASNNKFSLLGGLRVSAQIISYEVTLGLNLVGIFMVYESLTLQEIIVEQGELLWGFLPAWGIVLQPVAFFLFIIAATAESKRAPFDVAEAEPELVAGYHLEYSSMKFALFALGEFVEVVVIACITACVFLGGWQIPGVEPTADFSMTTLLQIGAFLTKVVLLCALQMTIRWTLPRFRYDQVMKVCWKYLLPLSLANILGTGVVLYLIA